LSATELLDVYRESALYHRIVHSHPLPETVDGKRLDGVTIQDGRMVWYPELARTNGKYILYIWNKPKKGYPAASGWVSYAGIAVKLFLDRECRAATFSSAAKANTSESCGNYLGPPPKTMPNRVLIYVHVPVTGLAPLPNRQQS
jgi:hypothetical protein